MDDQLRITVRFNYWFSRIPIFRTLKQFLDVISRVLHAEGSDMLVVNLAPKRLCSTGWDGCSMAVVVAALMAVVIAVTMFMFARHT